MHTQMPSHTTPPLSEFPEINAFLARLGLGELTSPDSIRGRKGRNPHWSGVTDSGRKVFVKRLDAPAELSAARIRQSLAFDRLLRSHPHLGLSSPRCLGADVDGRLLVFELVEEARTAAELTNEGELTEDLAYELGVTVGRLHELPVTTLRGDPAPTPLLPSLELLEGLPAPMFEAASAAELQMWSLVQDDSGLLEAVRGLLTREQLATPVAAHCDLRLDQFLVSQGKVFLTDLEEFRAGDPARDLGGVVGDVLHRAVLDAAALEPAGEGDDATARSRMVSQVAEGIRSARPVIAAFRLGYRTARADAGTAVETSRVVAFAGWHLLDRLLAGAGNAARLSALGRAAAGIGRKALLSPGAFVPTLGLGEAPA
ncbi:class V lanthionine synthetase subunit LxmK [Streptomyces sp. NPDC058239]|uniref:class V lanthionine synthetase subunit LxmK n=1 Tax=Streptomyces sp. NPDC058239 TaxID=3346395 RepID=UPI0036EE855E